MLSKDRPWSFKSPTRGPGVASRDRSRGPHQPAPPRDAAQGSLPKKERNPNSRRDPLQVMEPPTPDPDGVLPPGHPTRPSLPCSAKSLYSAQGKGRQVCPSKLLRGAPKNSPAFEGTAGSPTSREPLSGISRSASVRGAWLGGSAGAQGCGGRQHRNEHPHLQTASTFVRCPGSAGTTSPTG